MKINYKKMVKLATLLVTSLLIAKASADTYTYLFMHAGITVTSQQVVWIYGGQIISGSTVTPSFTVQQGVYTWYNNTLHLKNTGGTNVTVNITVTSQASSSVFDICKVYVYENFTTPGTWTFVGTLNALTLGDVLNNKLLKANGGYFKFDFEIQAKTTATPGTYNFEITVVY
ncbi:MAG: hypothetical protein QXK47_05420 [Candidatus Bathyarchaeia archaeon]